MSHDNSEQLLGTEGNTYPISRKRKFFDVGSSRSSSLNPTLSRVFDVYVNNNDSPQNLQLLDIFSDEMKSKQTINDPMINTTLSTLKDDKELPELDGQPLLDSVKQSKQSTSQSTTGEEPQKVKILEDTESSKDVQISDKLATSTEPSTIRSPHNKLAAVVPSTTQQQTQSHALYLKDGYDKWSNSIEEVFIRALRLVMKNGTSKIKLREKNYGRNELISLYIKYYTGEFRTKKQISSHIQVWKKAILNKVSNNIHLTTMDQELLSLIEEGAPQTEESTKLFYETFDTILSRLKPSNDGYDYVPVQLGSAPKNTQGAVPYSVYPVSNSNALNYPSLITPKSAPNANNTYSNNLAYNTLDQPHFQNMNTHPITPLDYAKSLYGDMKSYKCVPAKIEDDSYTSFLKDMAGSNRNDSATLRNEKTDSNNSAISRVHSETVIKNAEKVKAEQRRLIEELNRKSKTAANIELPGIGNRSVSNNSFYDRLPYTQEEIPLRQKDWMNPQDSTMSMYMMPTTQGQGPIQSQLQRNISGNSIQYGQDFTPHYLQSQAQAQAQAQQTIYPGQYLVPISQQQQQLQSQQGLSMSKMSPQAGLVSYSQQSGSQTRNQMSAPPSSVYYYPRHTYIPSSNNYPNGPFRSNQSIPYNDFPFEQFPTGSQEFE